MPNLTLRHVPDELHAWLKETARTHRRSVNREVILLLEVLREGQQVTRRKASLEELLEIGRRAAALPVLDRRGEAEILGFDETGVSR